MRNAEAIQAMGMLAALMRNWTPVQAAAAEGQAIASTRSAVLAAAARFLRLGLQIGVLGLGAYLVLHAGTSPGAMVAASILMGRALAPVEQAIGTWKGVVAARSAYRRLAAVAGTRREEGPILPLPRPKGRVEGMILARQGGGEPILKGIGFQEPGEVMARADIGGSSPDDHCKHGRDQQSSIGGHRVRHVASAASLETGNHARACHCPRILRPLWRLGCFGAARQRGSGAGSGQGRRRAQAGPAPRRRHRFPS